MHKLTPPGFNNAKSTTGASEVDAIDRLRLQFVTGLQTTLELDQLVSIFANYMQTLFGISGVSFVATDPDINVSHGETAVHHCSYKLDTGGQVIGEVCLYSRKRLSDTDLLFIEVATSTLVYPLRNAIQYRAAQVKAHSDPLTSLGNRLAMNAALKREVSRAKRHNTALSVLMIDLDHFKTINDEYGHATGDRILASVAEILRNTAREEDNAFRYGGEEFLVLLDGTDCDGANTAAERLRQRVAEWQPDIVNLRHKVTVSVGCATLQPDDTVSELTERADSALYLAKSGGRNCVRAA